MNNRPEVDGNPDVDDDENAVGDTDATTVADADPVGSGEDGYVDELPEDLDITALAGVYEFPNNAKRRIASLLYLATGILCLWLGFAVDSPLTNVGIGVVGAGLVAFAVWSYAVAVPTRYDETDALVVAAQVTGLVAGPAAAQMTWRGWRSRPVWRVLLFSAEEQPLHRAIVLVDGVTGEVLEHFVEENPEDWSELQ
ncbi:MAG: hypothetical protein ACE367_08550 [Acidimicrobiales bacterium]